MKISVITIVYNGASLLEETMKSVLTQDWPDKEYIIIDGGSTDGTMDIVERYREQLAYVVSEPDKGIYDAMNKGIRLASGDIIGLINCGDYYYPKSLSKVAKTFAQGDLEDKILWGDVHYEHLGRVLGFRPNNLKRGAFAPHPSMFCPRKVYEKIGLYDTSFKLLGDYDFMYRAINCQNIKPIYLPEELAFYAEGGLSDRNVKLCLQDELRVKLKYGQHPFYARFIYLLKLLKNIRRL